MKEIGGYIELEHFNRPMLHDDGIKLNCGRNCLGYLIKARKIKRIALPYFLCETVQETCYKYGLDVQFFHVDRRMRPIYEKDCADRWVYVVNYYGLLADNEIRKYKEEYETLIIDNAQAYYSDPILGVDTIYTCRKYFGVPDGGILYSDAKMDEQLEQDVSLDRMHFLLGRFEGRASDFYREYVENNEIFKNEPVKMMSRLTENLLRAVDYDHVKHARSQNYVFLKHELEQVNMIETRNVEGAFAYPLMVEDGQKLRNRLIENKVYVPILWPNVVSEMDDEQVEYELSNNILPLPCDQRYTETDMMKIVALIKKQCES